MEEENRELRRSQQALLESQSKQALKSVLLLPETSWCRVLAGIASKIAVTALMPFALAFGLRAEDASSHFLDGHFLFSWNREVQSLQPSPVTASL